MRRRGHRTILHQERGKPEHHDLVGNLRAVSSRSGETRTGHSHGRENPFPDLSSLFSDCARLFGSGYRMKITHEYTQHFDPSGRNCARGAFKLRTRHYS